jgi:putative peptidoglycan lipid II flippase
MAVGFFLSLPIVIMLFQRGQFLYSDATVVAEVLQIYLMAVIGMSMGSITSKVFYALKDTKTLAILGCVEAVVYVGYATYLTRLFGTHGLAISYAVYFNLSLLLQLFILKYKIGGKGIRLLKSIAKITVASILSGAVAYFTKEHILSVFLQVIISSTIGVITYLLVMYVLNSSELMFITNGINKIWQGNELEK